MNAKTLLVLLVVAALAVGGAFLVSRRNAQPIVGNLAGKPVLGELALDKIAALRLTQADGKTLLLHQREARWTVADLYDYPADFARIVELVRTLTEMKAVQAIAAGPDQFPRLELAPPGAPAGAGVKVELLDRENQPLASFIAGKMHLKKGDTEQTVGSEWPVGRYLLTGANRVVLVEPTLDRLAGAAPEWLDKTFVNAAVIKSATLERGGVVQWRLSRADPNLDLVADNVPEGKQLDKAKADAIGRALNYLRFATVADPKLSDDEAGMNQGPVCTFETFDQRRITFRLGKELDGRRLARVAVAALDLPPPSIPEGMPPDQREKVEKEHREKVEKAKAAAAEEQTRHSAWLYLFDSYSVEAMLTKPEELCKEPGKDEKAGAANPAAPDETKAEALKPVN